jgi:hypothetical protein
MKKQTAVEWLIEQIHSEEYSKAFGTTYLSVVFTEQAQKMEKEQIINAYNSGTFYTQGEDYFKKTFEDESGI